MQTIKTSKEIIDEVANNLKPLKGSINWKVNRWDGKGSIMRNGYFASNKELNQSESELVGNTEKIVKSKLALDDLIALDELLELDLARTIDAKLLEKR